MKIAIGALLGPLGGVSEYGRQLIRSLSQLRGSHRFVVITDCPDQLVVSDSMEVVPLQFHGGLDRLRWQHLALPRLLRRLRPDLYHDTKNALPWRCPVPSVVTIHDLAMYRCPETFPPASRLFLRTHIQHAVQRARRLIAVSESTRRDLVELFGAGPRTAVVPNGVSSEFFEAVTPDRLRAVLDRYALTPPYVLAVGTLQPRKRVGELMAAVQKLRAAGRSDLRLVIVGREGWKSDSLVRRIEADPLGIRWLGAVPREDLPALYAGATVFAAPSSYEGFGLTVAEALAVGAPVLTTRISSLPEVAGQAAEYVERPTVSELATAVEALLDDPGRRAILSERGRERARRFQWDHTALETVSVYEAALAGPVVPDRVRLADPALDRFSQHWLGKRTKDGSGRIG